jgi:hypothetical protein
VRTVGENPYYQFFCGEEFFQHRLVFDRSSMTRWRNRMGEKRLQALIQESLSVATRTVAIKPSELSRVIVDTTVQPKNVTFPTDAKLLNRAREKLVRLAQLSGIGLRQSYARVGKFALIQSQRYAHAKQFKRANRMLKKLRTYLGRVIRRSLGWLGVCAMFSEILKRAVNGRLGLSKPKQRYTQLRISSSTPFLRDECKRRAPPLLRCWS